MMLTPHCCWPHKACRLSSVMDRYEHGVIWWSLAQRQCRVWHWGFCSVGWHFSPQRTLGSIWVTIVCICTNVKDKCTIFPIIMWFYCGKFTSYYTKLISWLLFIMYRNKDTYSTWAISAEIGSDMNVTHLRHMFVTYWDMYLNMLPLNLVRWVSEAAPQGVQPSLNIVAQVRPRCSPNIYMLIGRYADPLQIHVSRKNNYIVWILAVRSILFQNNEQHGCMV